MSDDKNSVDHPLVFSPAQEIRRHGGPASLTEGLHFKKCQHQSVSE